MIKQLSISNFKSSFLTGMTGSFLFILLLSARGNAYAGSTNNADTLQKEIISTQAATEIKYQAESVVHTLEAVLNSITFNDNTPSETANYITSSYTPNLRNRIFFNDNIIIEDDINPQFELGKNRDMEVKSYLNELDLNYQKTADFSIKFSNIKSSDVKKTNHIYIRVMFDCIFGSRYKINGKAYPIRHREALIRMEPEGKKKWNAFIEGISYYSPSTSPIESKDHDMLVVDESVVAATDDGPTEPALIRNKMPIANKRIMSTDHKLVQYINNTEGKLVEYPDFSVVFNKNLKAPDVKTVNPVFHIKISFDSDFGTKNGDESSVSVQGEAVIRMERNGKNEWNAFVESVSFKKPNKSQDQDMILPPADSAVAAGISQMLDKSIKMAMVPGQSEADKKGGQK
jgi:hypothetical protein